MSEAKHIESQVTLSPSSNRSVLMIKEQEKYRKRFLSELKCAFGATDYLLEGTRSPVKSPRSKLPSFSLSTKSGSASASEGSGTHSPSSVQNEIPPPPSSSNPIYNSNDEILAEEETTPEEEEEYEELLSGLSTVPRAVTLEEEESTDIFKFENQDSEQNESGGENDNNECAQEGDSSEQDIDEIVQAIPLESVKLSIKFSASGNHIQIPPLEESASSGALLAQYAQEKAARKAREEEEELEEARAQIEAMQKAYLDEENESVEKSQEEMLQKQKELEALQELKRIELENRRREEEEALEALLLLTAKEEQQFQEEELLRKQKEMEDEEKRLLELEKEELLKQKAAQERIERDLEEQNRLEALKLESEEISRQKEELLKQKAAQERLERELEEQNRLEALKLESERLSQQKEELLKQKAAQERMERELEEQNHQKATNERLAREKEELLKQKAAQERLERSKALSGTQSPITHQNSNQNSNQILAQNSDQNSNAENRSSDGDAAEREERMLEERRQEAMQVLERDIQLSDDEISDFNDTEEIVQTMEDSRLPPFTYNGTLLEVSTRPFLYYLTQKYERPITRLREIPQEELDSFKECGFDWIWFMGVWTLGQKGREFDRRDDHRQHNYSKHLPGWTPEDVIGSPYSIYSYDPSPEIGGEEDLLWLREELHQRGIRLMLDFVPNHSALDAPETITHPEFYIHKSGISENGQFSENSGNMGDSEILGNSENFDNSKKEESDKYDERGFAYGRGFWMKHGWKDVLQYDYFNEGLWEFQTDNLIKVSQYCDGVRCDVAWLILAGVFRRCWKKSDTTLSGEFWTHAISAVRVRHPHFIFMAEVYGKRWASKALLKCGFDFVYDIAPTDMLVRGELDLFVKQLQDPDTDFLKHCVHFSENHDISTAIERFDGNVKKANLATAMVLLLPGLKMFNFAQYLGWRHTLCVQLRRISSYETDQTAINFYRRLFLILKMDAVRNGDFTFLPCRGTDGIITWRWAKGEQRILVTCNYRVPMSIGQVVCDDAPLTDQQIPVRDLVEDKVYMRNPYEMRSSGLGLILWEYHTQIFIY